MPDADYNSIPVISSSHVTAKLSNTNRSHVMIQTNTLVSSTGRTGHHDASCLTHWSTQSRSIPTHYRAASLRSGHSSTCLRLTDLLLLLLRRGNFSVNSHPHMYPVRHKCHSWCQVRVRRAPAPVAVGRPDTSRRPVPVRGASTGRCPAALPPGTGCTTP